VTLCGDLAACVDRDHLPGALAADADFEADARFDVGARLDCRVLLVHGATKVVRLTCAPHLLDLSGAGVDVEAPPGLGSPPAAAAARALPGPDATPATKPCCVVM